MIQAYNFLYSWQLFPEKGIYEKGERPKSGIYKLSASGERNNLSVEMNWVTLENQAFSSDYVLEADGDFHSMTDQGVAEKAKVQFIDSISFEILLLITDEMTLRIFHEIQPNGYLKVTEQSTNQEGNAYQNISYYHKQMSVLPYSTSVSGAVIRPTEEGMIRHKSLTAMEEQTNMQLTQIRRQIELLAACFGQGEADQSTTMGSHEIDRFRRHKLGRDDEVTLIFTILVIHKNDHFAGLDVGNNIGDRAEAHARLHVRAKILRLSTPAVPFGSKTDRVNHGPGQKTLLG